MTAAAKQVGADLGKWLGLSLAIIAAVGGLGAGYGYTKGKSDRNERDISEMIKTLQLQTQTLAVVVANQKNIQGELKDMRAARAGK